jgi:hypothetical protein
VTKITIEEFRRLQAEEAREARRKSKAFADAFVAAIKAGDGEALFDIGTADHFYNGWHAAFGRIGNDAVPDISPEIKIVFQQVWIEKKQMALTIDNTRLLCRALRRLLPPYSGPAVVLYRGATRRGWRRGVSWSDDIEAARLFCDKGCLPCLE